MFKDDLFDDWLDTEAQSVMQRFKAGETLSDSDKMTLALKSQSNHFVHLDIELRDDIKALGDKTDKRFKQVDKRFEQVDKRFEHMDKRMAQFNQELIKLYQAINHQTWKMLGGVGLIVILGKIIDDLPIF